MENIYNKKVNSFKLLDELKAAGINVQKITTDKDNSLIVFCDKNPDAVVNSHIFTSSETPKEKYAKLLLDTEKLDFISGLMGLK